MGDVEPDFPATFDETGGYIAAFQFFLYHVIAF